MRKFWICIAIALVVAGALGAYLLYTGLPASTPSAVFLLLLGVEMALNLALAFLAYDRHRAFAKVRETEQAFRDLYDNISEGVFRSTLDGRMISANPSLVRLNGYSDESTMLADVNDIGARWYVQPGRREEIHRMLLEQGQVTNLVSEIYRYKTRERIWIEENTRLVRHKTSGAPLYYDGTVREVTETIRRLELQDRYNKIASVVSACLYQHRARPDGSACMPYASIGLLHIFGIEPQAVMHDGRVLAERIHADDLPRITASLDHSSRTLTVWQCEYRVLWPEGQTTWVLAHAAPEREADGSTLWHGYIMDVSERKRSEERIHDLAYFDPLTKLPNRAMLSDKLTRVLATGGAGAGCGAVLFIDLDQFKVLNDSKGHHVGDLFLCEVARRIAAQVRAGDLVARLGGDEFVVLLQNLPGDSASIRERVEAVGAKVSAAIAEPYLVGEQAFRTTASIGAALFGDGTLDLDDILKRADLAMYEAKAGGRGRFCFFAPAMQEAAEDRLALSSDLRLALAGDGLSLFYQPQVDRNGKCTGAEALLRWSHPIRGEIAPPDILSLADSNGLINPLEEWVLRTACTTLTKWETDLLTRDFQLAVNVSAHQLNRAEFVAMVKDALAGTGADPARLRLELTEHVMLDNIDKVSAHMLELKGLGVSFALDDFGTGYSSLSYLKRLPIDALKIDQSFVRDLETDPSDREIVQTIVNIARSLKVCTVAEGVETEMQALFLRQLGCQGYQGYFYGRPVPLADFHAALGASAAVRPHAKARRRAGAGRERRLA